MKDDKFVLMGLNDPSSSDVAEALKNKTCKKILDFLAEEKEASEKDISKALNSPINTVEYNLKKLEKAGFVKKSGNFFWSEKGRKIKMYKLAKKHIIISPGKKPSLSSLKSILPVLGIIVLLGVLASVSFVEESNFGTGDLKQFENLDELEAFLKEGQKRESYFPTLGFNRDVTLEASVASADGTGNSVAKSGAGEDFSGTNIQVEGVDEADIVKTDGKYIYLASGNGILILEAFPSDEMQIISKIILNNSAREIFVNGDTLVVFTQGTQSIGILEDEVSLVEGGDSRIAPGYYGGSGHSVLIYDISDRKEPKLEETIAGDDNYLNSRMIGSYVYVISTKYANLWEEPSLPIVYERGVAREVGLGDLYYYDYLDTSYIYTTIKAIDLNSKDVEMKTYLTGSTGEIYVSQENIYLTSFKYNEVEDYVEDYASMVAYPLLPSKLDLEVAEVIDSNDEEYEKLDQIRKIIWDYSADLVGDAKAEFDEELIERDQEFNLYISKEREQTIIHKINIDEEEIEYVAQGSVPGRVLNQFSMDEFDENFRIATTTGDLWGGTSLNHLYVLDEDLEIIGSVNDLAQGERIYSARFLGERAYLVTFKKVDPFFVIDLENPKDPEVLGYLKITGYSDYLHVYDENHVIGIGKETAGGGEDFSYYQGVKISLFDVSDVANPIEKAKMEIGDRGTQSQALWDHRAFLFSKERNLLVLPIDLAEINEAAYPEGVPDYAWGETVWQGAYVLYIDDENLELRKAVNHESSSVLRSLYIDDSLYTISGDFVQAHNLNSLERESFIEI